MLGTDRTPVCSKVCIQYAEYRQAERQSVLNYTGTDRASLC